MPRRLVLGIATFALIAAARGPLLRATLRLPLTNDDALTLLMSRHLLRGELVTTFWNAPYNGALDSYLLAPGQFHDRLTQSGADWVTAPLGDHPAVAALIIDRYRTNRAPVARAA